MSAWSSHLLILPIVLPLAAGALMLLLDPGRHLAKTAIGLVSTVGQFAVAVMMLRIADAGIAQVGVYRLGDWPALFGIVLAVDRLSAAMLLLTSILSLAALLFSLARWQRAGMHFQPLFQFLLMGLNGAFLTGDLFNLFVFFEVLLAASYGLALHGSGIARVRAGLQYIAVNLMASMLFLIGVSLIYGMAGTLNMAELAIRIPAVPPENRMLLEAGAAILGIAFLVKAGMWPLCFWLPTTYAAAAAPVAAVFAIMTKVGVYVVLRLWLLFFGHDAGAAGFGGPVLLFGGIATIVFGAVGVLASQDGRHLVAFSVLVSSGTLLAAIGTGQPAVTGGGLFYLASSTLAIGAFFLLVELVDRDRDAYADILAVTMEAGGWEDEDEKEEEDAEIGIGVPATMTVLGACFLACALVVAGLPPLSGFIGKLALLDGILRQPQLPASAWVLVAVLVLSSLAALVALTRAGIRSFWLPLERAAPRVGIVELAPVLCLLLGCVTMTVEAGPVMRYLQATADELHAPRGYVTGVTAPAPAGEGSAAP